jgi:hypothetical protein
MRPRFSILGLMAVVLLAAVALASLREPTEAWAQAMFSLAVLASGVALLGLLLRRGVRRATSLGFLVFGTGYLTLCFGPGLDSQVSPRLLTSALIDAVYSKMEYAPGQVGERVWVQWRTDQISEQFIEGRVFETRTGPTGDFRVATASTTSSYVAAKLRPISPDSFRQLCHADLSLLFGLVGAAIARLFFEPPESGVGA